jgi:hypothetical protein
MLDLLKTFNRDGYIIVENLLDGDEAFRLRDICDAIPQGVNVDSDEWWTDYSYNFDEQDKEFLDTVTEKQKHIADILFQGNENYSSGAAGFKVTNPSGGKIAPHFDTPYDRPEYYNDFGAPKCIQGCILVDKFDHTNGGTMIWPGSQYIEFDYVKVLNGEYNEQFLQNGVSVTAAAGSAMFFHARVMHSTMPNNSSNKRRLMLNLHTVVEDTNNE